MSQKVEAAVHCLWTTMDIALVFYIYVIDNYVGLV